MTRSEQRDKTFDNARAFCALEIIAFWHLNNYLPEEWQFNSDLLNFGEKLTWGTLSCFTFMSGYFLSKHSFSSWSDVLSFYKKRLVRFYGLYLVAVLSLYVGGLIVGTQFFKTNGQFIRTVFGLGCLTRPYPPTVWYFCMIVFFYFLTPLLMVSKNLKWNIIIAFILFVLLFILKWFNILDVDERLLVYYVFFALGLYIPKISIEKLKNIPLISLLFFPYIIWAFYTHLNLWQGILLNLLFLICLIPICALIRNVWLCQVLGFISYGSMVAYLFHRHFYLASVLMYNYPDFRPLNEATLPLPIALFVVVPIIFLFSYCIQKFYYSFCKRVFKV